MLIIASLSAPLLIGAAGLATDTIQWTLDRRELQRSADSAALAGAYALAQSEAAVASAEESIGRTNELVLEGSPVIEWPPGSGAFAGNVNTVRVTLRTRRNLPFSSLFLSTAPLIEVSGTAQLISEGEYCVISLDDTSDTGVTISGSTSVDLGCGVFANSTGSNAVLATGSSRITATPIGAVGGIQSSDSFVQPTTLLPYSIPQDDPFSDLPDPEPSSCLPKITVEPHQTRTISPGCYRGMELKGTVYFEPGTYYIDSGPLTITSQADVTGSGVTFILTSQTANANPASVATVDIDGQAQIDLTAPTEGTYEGVLFYQDRRANRGHVNDINGGSSSRLRGAFYFPRQTIEFSGGSGMATDCVRLVGAKVTFIGNSAINNNCPSNGSREILATIVRLVG